ncbi:hypothetical protein HZC27_01180 [Candidatus Roizmanbacteria bacterium]|nr:hypothetical protein [Candidatus Roizmanbacteria bacterium]
MIKKKLFDWPVWICIGISLFIFFFYLFFINLSTDTIILFLAQKLFLGKWLARGIIPLFNPHIFLGIPFLFDVGMGNLHPFNLFFILPYPYSFAFWSAATSLLFLVGFYLLFGIFSKDKKQPLLLTLIFFFSGSGFFLRMNNPTIFSVIAHYGVFAYSLYKLKDGTKKSFFIALFFGLLLTLSGHFQFVLYGYILGIILSLFYYKNSFKKTLFFFFILSLLTSWYYLLSIPLIIESTRLTLRKDYIETGPIYFLQFIQLFFPFVWGYVQNGSKWGVGPTNVLLSSVVLSLGLSVTIIKRKIDVISTVLLSLLLIFSLGFVNLPFFRGPGQIFILIHIFTLIVLARNEKVFTIFSKEGVISLFGYLSIILALGALFIVSPIFSVLFIKGYKILKHGQESLFFDLSTVQAIGKLIALSFVPIILFGLTLSINNRWIKNIQTSLILFVILEGVLLNFFHNYFTPSRLFINNNSTLPQVINSQNYRVQTASDVVPYTGFHNYMGNVLFRPPFSKEPPVITDKESQSFGALRNIFGTIPSSWAMVEGINAVQGYNTFVPQKLAHYFDKPSSDYRQEYVYILERNSLFAQSEKGSHINAIESSRITLGDPRWGELGVRYFISDRPLKKYTLISQAGNKYFYENKDAIPVKHFTGIDGKIEAAKAYYENPNEMLFQIKKEDLGKKLIIIINPNGFVAELNGKKVNTEKQDFKLIIPIKEAGILKIYYSPLFHLREMMRPF